MDPTAEKEPPLGGLSDPQQLDSEELEQVVGGEEAIIVKPGWTPAIGGHVSDSPLAGT